MPSRPGYRSIRKEFHLPGDVVRVHLVLARTRLSDKPCKGTPKEDSTQQSEPSILLAAEYFGRRSRNTRRSAKPILISCLASGASCVRLGRICHPGDVPNDTTSPYAAGFGLCAMRKAVRTIGSGPDRRELGLRRLQDSILEPDRSRWASCGLVPPVRRGRHSIRRPLH